VDAKFMSRHATWMIDYGYTALIMLGSLGEAATLSYEEKVSILKNMVSTVKGRVRRCRGYFGAGNAVYGGAGQGSGGCRLFRVDDSAALRLPWRLA
jgi:Dihydrodipicolinate synthetase family